MASKAVKLINKGYHHRYPGRINGNHGGSGKVVVKSGGRKK